MNKKLLIAAVGAALVAGPMLAQADVKIGGYINMSLDSIKGNNGKTPASNSTNWDVSSNASNIVLSADEDLGGGLKGIFSLQNFFRLDNNNGAGSTNTMTGGNAALGLNGSAGTVLLGNWDSGAKQNGRTFDLFGNQIGDARNADVNNNRYNNSVIYQSPNMSGFSALVAHSTNTNTTATTDLTTEANSLMAKYEQGPLAVGLGYDKEKPSTGSGDKWTNIGGKYTLPSDTSLILFYQKHDNVGGVTSSNNKTTGLGVAQKFGNNTVKFQYYMVKMHTAAADAKPKLYALGLDHGFSKTFAGYVAYAKAKNETGTVTTNMSMAGPGHGDNPGTVTGENMTGFSIGAIMKF
ncbi:MAG: porin [Sulfuricaulis sp.]